MGWLFGCEMYKICHVVVQREMIGFSNLVS